MGLPSLPCPQVRVYFSPVSFKTHLTPHPKDTRIASGNHMSTGREGTWLVKHLQPWPPGCGQWGETPAPTYHLWATDSFSLTSDYSQSISGIFFWNWLIKPPSCSENEGNPSPHNPNNAVKSSFPPLLVVTPKPMLRGRRGPWLQGAQVFIPKSSTKAVTARLLEPVPYSIFIPPPVSLIKKEWRGGRKLPCQALPLLSSSCSSFPTSCFVPLGKPSYPFNGGRQQDEN